MPDEHHHHGHHGHEHHRPPPNPWERLIPLLTSLLRDFIEALERLLPGPPASARITFYAKGAAHMGVITVAVADSPLTATVTYLDAEGNATSPADVPQWASSDEGVATVAAADDGLTASVALVAAGAANITANTTDADGTVVSALGTVTVTPNPAASGDIEFTEAG